MAQWYPLQCVQTACAGCNETAVTDEDQRGKFVRLQLVDWRAPDRSPQTCSPLIICGLQSQGHWPYDDQQSSYLQWSVCISAPTQVCWELPTTEVDID